jgi:hypothetical protein
MIVAVLDILQGTTDITDVVAATEITAARRLEGAPLPAIIVEVTASDTREVKEAASKIDFDDFQVTCFAERLKTCSDVMDDVRTALDNVTGVQTGVTFQRISYTGQRHDYYNTDDGLYSWTHTYRAIIQMDASGFVYPPGDSIDIINPDDSVAGTFPVGKDIKVGVTVDSLDNTGDPAIVNQTAPAPSGIVYNQIYPNQIDSYENYDTGYNVQNGLYKRTYPVYPISYAVPYYLADQSAVRVTPATGTLSTDSVWPTVLVDNNSFGNKLVYTDTLGNPSDSSGDELYSHVDWINHSFTGAEDGIVIDHVRNLTIDINYITDGTKFSLSSTAADGQAWRDWLAHVGTLGTHHGLTGWRVPSLEEANAGAHGAKIRREPWALKFFNAERSDNRCGMLTGDTVDDDTTDFWVLYDSGNQVYMQELQKAVSSGFANRITNIFILRNHHA